MYSVGGGERDKMAQKKSKCSVGYSSVLSQIICVYAYAPAYGVTRYPLLPTATWSSKLHRVLICRPTGMSEDLLMYVIPSFTRLSTPLT